MYKVIYKYDFVERKRVYKGFEVETIVKEELVGEYDSLEEAKKHKTIEIEKKFPKGVYEIIKIN